MKIFGIPIIVDFSGRHIPSEQEADDMAYTASRYGQPRSEEVDAEMMRREDRLVEAGWIFSRDEGWKRVENEDDDRVWCEACCGFYLPHEH